MKNANIGLIQKVLKNLLKAQIPIKDMLSILEAITDSVEKGGKSVDMITEHTRAALARIITSMYVDERGRLSIYLLDNATTQTLMNAMDFTQAGEYRLQINVNQTEALVNALKGELAKVAGTRIKPFVLCVEPNLRKVIADFCSNFGINMIVLSFAEIADNTSFETEGVINVGL